MKLDEIYCPEVSPLSSKEFDALVWEGPFEHVGSVHTVTPLQAAISEQTNCANYLLMVGAINLIKQLTTPIFSPRLNECSMEFIYLYQFDWRFPKTWRTSAKFVMAYPDKWQSVRESVPIYFLQIMYRENAAFFPGSAATQTSFLINLARHIAGPKREAVVDEWLKVIINRLDIAAPFSGLKSLSLLDFPDRASHLAALRDIHGAPLSVRLLDPDIPLGEIDHKADALATFNAVDFLQNPLLRPVSEFTLHDGVPAPFYSAEMDW